MCDRLPAGRRRRLADGRASAAWADVASGAGIRHAAAVRRVGAVVVVLGVILAGAAILMAAMPFSTSRVSDDGVTRVDCGIPWVAWSGDEGDRCADLARSRVDGATTVGFLGLLVMGIGFVARRRRPAPRRLPPRRPPIRPVPPVRGR
jgi:MYXO-CTERM domain-containing protein